jgi:uncharacterized protein (DUF2336 family)
MLARQSLFAELEDAIDGGSREKRVNALKQITDLFLTDANRFNDEQIGLFDDVITQLIGRIEAKALSELSEQLAPVSRAPIEVVRQLANHDEIEVAGPILARSARLTDSDLVEIAKTKSQHHLLAISARRELHTGVTDVLTDRGNQDVMRRLASNAGAEFSEAGMETLTSRAENDVTLAELLGRRLDMPLQFLRKLLQRATEAVRSKLLSCVNPERQAELRFVMAKISKAAQEAVGRDYADAQRTVESMHRGRKLNEDALLLFAISKRFEHVVIALSVLSSTPFELIDELMHSERTDAVLVPCKAAGLEWATVRAILNVKSTARPITENNLEELKRDYGRLSITAAGRVLRFWQVREKTAAASAAEAG